jgi:DNA-binding transcriptional LysR family regulator
VFGRLHVVALVARFMAAHPAVTVELQLSDRYADLIEEGLDLAVRIGHLADSGLVARRVGEVRRVTVASPAYLRPHPPPSQPTDLRHHATIFTMIRPVSPEWRFAVAGHERAVALTPRLTVNQVDAALLAAREGQGIASALSYQVAEDLAAGRLVRLLEAYELPSLPVRIVLPSARHTPRRVRAFLDAAVAELSGLDVLRPLHQAASPCA